MDWNVAAMVAFTCATLVGMGNWVCALFVAAGFGFGVVACLAGEMGDIYAEN